MTMHTADLDHAIVDALHTADTVQICVLDQAADGAPTAYRAIVSCDGTRFFSTPQDTAIAALARAMQLVHAKRGDGPTRVVDFAAIRVETGEQS